MVPKSITIKGIRFLFDNYGGIFTLDYIEGIDTIDDAKHLLNDLLYTYVKEYPYNGTWSISVETKDGRRVELQWWCDCPDQCAEFIKLYVDNERIRDGNDSSNLVEAFEIGDAKETLSDTTDEEFGSISEGWFEDHVEKIIERHPDEFSEEEKKRAIEVKPLLCEY